MRWILVITVALVILFSIGFTTYYLNKEILLQPSGFNFDNTLAPLGASIPGTNFFTYDEGIDSYIFYYYPPGAPTESVRYQINVQDISNQMGALKIWEAVSNTYPVLDGGAYYRNGSGSIMTPRQFGNSANQIVFTHFIQGNNAVLNYVDTMNGVTRQKRYEIGISGKTLVIKAYAVNPSPNYLNNYAGFSFEKIGNANSARAVQVPYMKTATVSIINNNYFISTYLDWTQSNSNNNNTFRLFPSLIGTNYTNSFGSRYIPGQSNVYPGFSEVAYVTVSNNVHDTFMDVHRNKSPYRDDLSHRLSLHFSLLQQPGNFGNPNDVGRFYPNSNTIIDRLYQYGVKDIFLTMHSSFSLNNSVLFPNVCPPAGWYGSQTSLNKLKNDALSYGYRFAPIHHDTIDMFQNSPYWQNYCDNVTRIPISQSSSFPINIDEYGKCKLSGWYSSGSYFYSIAHDKMMDYVIPEMQCINNFSDSNAHYLDVSEKIALKDLVDYSSFSSGARTINASFVKNIEMVDYIHNSVDGPISAEGGEHDLATIDSFLAGKVDAYNREIFGREDAPVIPDFEQMVYNKLSVGQGMGSMERWVRQPPGNSGWAQPIDFDQFVLNKADKYRATIIAFGHTGFFDDVFSWEAGSEITLPEFYNYFVKEYYIFSKLQELYLSSHVEKIEYYHNSNFMNLTGVLKTFTTQASQNDYFVNQSRTKTTYENGLVVFVNRHLSSNWPITVNGNNYYLPPNGWFAYQNSSEFIAYTALVNSNGNPSPTGYRVDYIYTENYTMMNPRGIQTNFSNNLTGVLNTTYLTVIRPDGWVLLEDNLGNFSTTSITYCGDNYCSATLSETCNSCSQDCGVCPPPPPPPTNNSGGSGTGGGSGGGGGVFTPVPPITTQTECNDGIDNDGDELVDYPYDLGCSSANGNNEEDAFMNNTGQENPDYNDEISSSAKGDIEIRLIFWIVVTILISGILFTGVTILRLLKEHKRFGALSNLKNSFSNLIQNSFSNFNFRKRF